MERPTETEALPRFEAQDSSPVTDSSRTTLQDVPPPEFQQFTEKDFPQAGEVQIPFVSPLTAHVPSHCLALLKAVSSLCSSAVLFAV